MTEKRYTPGSGEQPGTGDQDQSSVAPNEGDATQRPVGTGLSGGVTDIDARDGEPDDSASGYSDEDLLRTNGGSRERK
jgi:hypothetical protein